MTTLKTIESLYKKVIKVLDKKNCHFIIVTFYKNNLLSFENCKNFKYACFIYKVLYGLAPPPLKVFIKPRIDCSIGTRSIIRGDCEVPYRRTSFGQKVLSVIGSKYWKCLPQAIRQCSNYHTFKDHLKNWLMPSQLCKHFT